RHALQGERLKVDIANMVFDTTEAIVETNKVADDYKNFEFELIKYFSITSPISEAEFKNKSVKDITTIIYKAALEYYQNKVERNAQTAFPVIKNVYENQSKIGRASCRKRVSMSVEAEKTAYEIFT